jgi:hypothetical protein
MTGNDFLFCLPKSQSQKLGTLKRRIVTLVKTSDLNPYLPERKWAIGNYRVPIRK